MDQLTVTALRAKAGDRQALELAPIAIRGPAHGMDTRIEEDLAAQIVSQTRKEFLVQEQSRQGSGAETRVTEPGFDLCQVRLPMQGVQPQPGEPAVFPELRQDQQRRVVDAIGEFYG